MTLLPSKLTGKAVDFDELNEYVISGDKFKSWNKDQAFEENGLNALYFRCTKPCKVEVEFVVYSKLGKFGMIDVVSWIPDHPQFFVRPIVLHFAPENRVVTKFQFYVNPFYLNRKEAYFEPRVFAGFHSVNKVRIEKLLILKSSRECKYTLFLLRRARKMLDLSQEECDAGDNGLSLHFSRLAVELSLKSIYPLLGTPFEKTHEISFSPKLRQRILKKVSNFPVSRLLWICQRHVRPARIDFYGDELGFAPSYSIVDQNEAERALNDAQYCFDNSSLLLDSFQKEA